MTTFTDTPPKDTPPRKINLGGRKTGANPTGQAGKPRMSAASIKKRLKEVINLSAAAIAMKNPFDAMVIGGNAEKIATAYAPLIERNPHVRKMFEYLEGAGAYG